MAEYTEHYQLSALSSGGDFADEGYKYTKADRHLIDHVGWLGAEGHVHDGAVYTAVEPDTPPTLELDTDGSGNIPAGTTVYYKYTYVTPRGEETAASPEAFVVTPAAIAEPSSPILSYATTGGILMAGNYFYAISSYTDASINETRAINSSYISVPATTSTNAITIGFPDPDSGQTGFNIYRRAPGQSKFFFLASVDTTGITPPTEYVDDGTVADDCDRTLPKANTTNNTNTITVSLPGATPALPDDGYTWKIYRTYVTGAWSSSFLVHVVEETSEGSGVIVTSYEDIGSSTLNGKYPDTTIVAGSPSKILLTGGAEVQGLLPASMIDGAVGGSTTILIAGPDASAEAQAMANYVCDGTNDEVEFQSAVDDVDALGGVIEVAGTLEFQDVVDITTPFNVVIRGIGYGRNTGPNGAITRTGGSGALFNITNDTFFQDIYIADEGTSARTTSLILNDGGTLKFQQVFFKNSQPTGACILQASAGEIYVRDCEIIMDNASSGDFIDASDGGADILIESSVYQTRNGYLIDYDDTLFNFTPDVTIGIKDCWTSTSGSSFLVGGLIRVVNGTNSGPLRVEIVGNTIANAQSIAIDLLDCTPVIVDNTFGRQGNPTTNLGTTAIKLSSCDNGGTVEGNVILHAGHHGIWLLDSSDINVANNVIRSYGRTTSVTYSGIILDGNSDRNTVTGNTLRKASSGNVPLYGIRIDDSTCNDNYVHANDIYNSSNANGSEVSDAGTSTRGQENLVYSLGDETTAITATGQKLAVRMPFSFVLSRVRGSLTTASSSGIPTFNVNEGGSTVLSTKLTIDQGEKTSTTAATPAVISDNYLADDAEITFDVDVTGTNATGAKVALIGWRI